MRYSIYMILGICVCLLGTFPAQATQTFKIPESVIDPESLRINEAKVLGLKPKRDFSFIDQHGDVFTFQDRTGKPLVLVMSYYTCDGVCSSVNIELGDRLSELEKTGRIKPGRDFDVVTVSFDKNDTVDTMQKFRKFVGLDQNVADGWTFAVASQGQNIKEFTDRYDFRFFWSAQDRTFFHPTVYMVLSPEMRLARILYAHDIEANDIELAVLDSKQGNFKPSEIINYAVSLCYSYSYKDGKYVFNIPMFVAFGSLIIGMSALGLSILAYKRRQRKREGLS
ncbi:MAG: SCO family protein [Methylocystaceae bacterium]|nr:SCO family protein [Methylocystaceae bacterium]